MGEDVPSRIIWVLWVGGTEVVWPLDERGVLNVMCCRGKYILDLTHGWRVVFEPLQFPQRDGADRLFGRMMDQVIRLVSADEIRIISCLRDSIDLFHNGTRCPIGGIGERRMSKPRIIGGSIENLTDDVVLVPYWDREWICHEKVIGDGDIQIRIEVIGRQNRVVCSRMRLQLHRPALINLVREVGPVTRVVSRPDFAVCVFYLC